MTNIVDKILKSFTDKVNEIREDVFQVDGDAGPMQISASPVAKHEIKQMIQVGKGLRILVGADDHRNFLAVWAGDGDSGIGAMHDTVAGQFGLSMYGERHVPLEMTPNGKLRVTNTVQAQPFDDAREVEDVLDRNKEFRKIFGTQAVDMSEVGSGGGW